MLPTVPARKNKVAFLSERETRNREKTLSERASHQSYIALFMLFCVAGNRTKGKCLFGGVRGIHKLAVACGADSQSAVSQDCILWDAG